MWKYILSIFALSILFAVNINARNFATKSVPLLVSKGSVVIIYEENTNNFILKLLDIELDGISNMKLLKSKTKDNIILQIPDNLVAGEHIIELFFDDDLQTQIKFDVLDAPSVRTDETIQADGTDPNPDTQYGEPCDCGKNPTGHPRGGPIFNPSGGYNLGNNNCDKMHKIDGLFTDSIIGSMREWAGIIPIIGKFSNFYVDYCSQSKTLYIMNDWILGDQNTDSSTCYNNFDFFTNGDEHWNIRVYNARNKGIKVIRNGIDVSNDTNFVVGGAYGFSSSILEEKQHAMWEFAIKTKGGMFTTQNTGDPVSIIQVPNTPTVVLKCDEATGYGLITEPIRFSGEINEKGVTLYSSKRYIPLQSVYGLSKDTARFSGNLSSTNSTVNNSGGNSKEIKCSGDNHRVDGKFTNDSLVKDEWLDKTPAKGRYSNLYADFCDSTLYIMNDWILGSREADESTCYNLFELYTGNGTQHWGIYVYHDINKGIKVFLNGVDVSLDTNYVLGGKFGYGSSPNEESAHTLYEFAIRCKEGSWNLQLCDPGPSTFCDDDKNQEGQPWETQDGKRVLPFEIGIRKNINSTPGEHNSLIVTNANENVQLTVGTFRQTSQLFSRKFKYTATFNSNDLNIKNVRLPESNNILNNKKLDSLKFTVNQNTLTIEGIANSNFVNSGDLFIIEAEAKYNSSNSIQFGSYVDFGNRDSYLRRVLVPSISIQKDISSVANNYNYTFVSVYPNPVKNKEALNLKFMLSAESSIAFTIIDPLASETKRINEKNYGIGEHTIQINTNDLANGTYFLNLIVNNQIFDMIPFHIGQ